MPLPLPVDVPQLPGILRALDLAGIAVFALAGASLAAQLKRDFTTLAFFALVTGVGGGSVRDLLIGAPVFWVRDPLVAPVCLGIALLVWFTPHRLWERRLFVWADAAGLAAYAVLGTVKALGYGVAPVPAALMGIITGCAGGIIRDLLAGQPSILMRPEIYITAGALAAAIAAGGAVLGWPDSVVWPVAALAGFALRGAAIRWSLAIPEYGRTQNGPGR